MSDLKILIEKNEENEVFASSKAAMESKIAQIVLGRFDCWIADKAEWFLQWKRIRTHNEFVKSLPEPRVY